MDMAAGYFKAHCLKLMDEVQKSHKEITITKHGKAVARLVPVPAAKKKPLFGYLKGMLTIHGDIVASTGEPWDADA